MFLNFIISNIAVNAAEINDTIIYNYDISNNYIVYESEHSSYRYIFLYNIQNKSVFPILSNDGDYINDDMMFPSISNDGKYVSYTSRASNITDNDINRCIDITDNITKYCSNIYIYNT